MEKIQFEAEGVQYPIRSIQPAKPHLMKIVYDDAQPDESVYGQNFVIFTNGGIQATTLTTWKWLTEHDGTTVYLTDIEPDAEETEEAGEPDLESMTLAELKVLASEKGISVKGLKKKADIIKAISEV